MAEATASSASPQALAAYSDAGLRMDAELETAALRLAGALTEFAATCREYPLGIDAGLAEPVRALARRTVEDDLWVRRVAAEFVLADASPGPGAAGGGPLDGLRAGLEWLGGVLPDMSSVHLDPNGPIARQGRGEAINPFDWSQELAGYESQTILLGAPAEIRDAQVTVNLPGVGSQTITTGALLALALDPANLVGGPEDAAGLRALEKALPYLQGPARAAAERLLGRSVSAVPAEAQKLLEPAAVKEAEAAYERAQAALTELNQRSTAFKDKVVAADAGSVKTLSGWKYPRPPGYDFVSPDDVYRFSVDELDYTPATHFRDRDFAGQFNSSHADKQIAMLSPDAPIGIAGRTVCDDCREFLRRMAQYTGEPMVVRDKDLGTIVFAADGSVIGADGKLLFEALPAR